MGNGIRMIAQIYGGLTVNGVHYKYDYARDELISEGELKLRAMVEKENRKAARKQAKQDQTGLELK